MAVDFLQVIPVLRIFDVAKAKEYYVDFLGFSVDWEHRFEENFPLYMQISRGGLVIHLSEHHGDGSPGANLYVRMNGIEEFHRELLGKQYRYARPGLEDTFHNSKEICVRDPFGNQIRFNEERAPA